MQMKKIFGRLYKLFLLTVLCFSSAQSCSLAYETVLINFPNGGWHKVYYENRTKEAIVQYVPSGQTKTNYTETIIFHSYKWALRSNMSVGSLLQYHLSQTALKYRDLDLKILKDDRMDSIAIWCSNTASQCEIVRSAQGYEGIITMHYINKNPQYFQTVCPTWLEIMRKVKIYYSYYRWDIIMNRANTVEL